MLSLRPALLPALLVCLSCSAPAPRPVPKEAVALPDLSSHFPQTGQVKMDLVPAHLLDKLFMPGGNLATYRDRKGEYMLCLGQLPDAQSAAFLLLDWKKVLSNAQYLSNMGGYFGMDSVRPLYVFTKGRWIAAVVGLPEAQADIVARQFAARL